MWSERGYPKGHFMTGNQPLAVCDTTARALGGDDMHLSGSTCFYGGGGCC
jgi:hypothetical protein